jgi:ATP phosphoribosyltransferase
MLERPVMTQTLDRSSAKTKAEEASESGVVMALPKGRILADCMPLLARMGVVPPADLVDEGSRRLRFPTSHPGIDIVRVRSFDVATFVAFGAADIGICGA